MKNLTLSSLLSLALVLSALAVLLVIVPQMVNAEKQELSKSAEVQAATPTRVAFNYQSNLTVKGQPANGLYDFAFKLYSDPTGSNQLGQTQTTGQVKVDHGLFTVFLDFGNVLVGDSLYLEVGVRPAEI